MRVLIRRFMCLFVHIYFWFVWCLPAKADLVLSPTLDGDIQHTGAIDTANSRVRMCQSGAAERRILFEFDFSALDPTVQFDSAILALTKDGSFANAGPNLPVHISAYEGDGAITFGDYSASATNVGDFVLDNSSVPPNGTEFLFEFDNLVPLQQALESTSKLLTIRLETESFATLNFASLDTQTSFSTPELRLNFTAVPEPNALLVLGATVLGMVCRYRRPKRIEWRTESWVHKP